MPYTAGGYNNSYPPSNTTTDLIYIFNSITLNGNNTVKNIIVENGGILSTNTVTPTFKNLLVKSGGVFNKESNGIKFDADGTLEVQNGGTMTFTRTNTTAHATNLWAGTEKFYPNSNFIVLVTDNAAGDGNLITEDINSISAYNGALFGNFIIDMQGNGRFPLLPPNITVHKFTAGDFIFRHGVDNRPIVNGSFTITIGGNLIVENTYNQTISLTTTNSTVGITVNRNVIHNGTAEFRLANSQTTNNPSVTLNIDSNLVVGSSNFNFDIGSSSTGTNRSTVNLKGDLTASSGNILTTNTTSAKRGILNFIGTYNSSDANTIQTIDVASTGTTTENANVNFNIKSGAYAQLMNRDFELGTNSKLTVETGSTFDFGFTGTTALNVAISGSQTGANFESKQASILKITSTDGLYGNYISSVFPSVTQTTGNLRIPKSGRTVDNEATFWYIGKANQQTGDAVNANNSGTGSYSTTANGKVVICDLSASNLTLTPSLSFGVSNGTNVSATGGKLDIRRGQYIETESAYIFGSTGTLYMAPGTLYKIAKGYSTYTDETVSSGGTFIPRMLGSTYAYNLQGGTIELAGDYNTGNGFQTLRGTDGTSRPAYKYVKFSGNNIYDTPTKTATNYKNLSSASKIDSALIITDNAIVNCVGSNGSALSFSGNGGLVMNGASPRLMIKGLNTPEPQLDGNNEDYSLTGGTVEFYGTTSTQQQQLRGNFRTSPSAPVKINYFNIDINAAAANLQTFSTLPNSTQLGSVGNVDMNSSFYLTGALNVNKPAVFRMDATDFIDNGTGTSQVVNINDGAGLLYGNSNGIKTSGTAISDGNIRTSGTRTFSPYANYGFVSNGDMVSGNGLPSSVAGLYTYRTNSTDKCTLNNGGTLITSTGSYFGRQANPPTDPSNFATLSNSGLAFNVTTAFVLNSVDVYNTNAGSFQIQLLDINDNPVYTSGTFTLTASSGTTPTTCNLGWSIPVGTDYKLVALGGSGVIAYLGRGTPSSYPYSLGSFGSITSGWVVGNGSSSSSYFYFYNWGVSLGILGLQNGKIESSSSNKLVMDVPLVATIQSPVNVGNVNNMGYENSYVMGLMGRKSNTTTQLIFPTGTSTVYGPFAVTPQNTTTQTYDGEYFSSGYGTYTLDPTNNPQLDHVSLVEYWTIKSSVTPSSNDDAKVKLFWRSHSKVSPTNTDWSNLRVVHFDNTDWNTEGTAPTINTTSTAWGSVESNIYCQNFSPFTLGTIISANPLPVELTSFTASCNNDYTANLNWSTASETNVKEFVVQKSTDGMNYTNIATVTAVGNSSINQNYASVDLNLTTDNAYYRLLIIDQDGTTKLSNSILLNCGDNTTGVNIYAVEQQGVFVKTNLTQESKSIIEVFDVTGKRIFNETIVLPRGYNKHHLDMNYILADGIYLVRLNTEFKTYSQKIWVH